MYHHSLEIVYSDDDEYRDCIRRVFSMDPANCTDDDGYVYDDKNVSAGLDEVFTITKDVPEFRDIYLVCAGKMLSTELEIGMALIFSYEYFDLFHLCLADYMRDGVVNKENYTKLYKKIHL
jgi:hypothetical protein